MVEPRPRIPGMGRTRHIFMVGIGGAGMSGIAEVLASLGYAVTGSDQTESSVVARLRSLGITVHIGHAAEHIENADVLVVSAAVPDDNPERLAARERRIPVVPRAEMLAELMRYRFGIAVAGTHGKTTTTSLIAAILGEAGEDPTFVIGGLLNQAGANAALGEGQYLVVEADESDASFLHLQPMMALVTNIEADHMEHYEGDLARYIQAFDGFLHNLPFYGPAVMCLDDKGVRDLIPELSRRVITYGRHSDADYRLDNYRGEGLYSHFELLRPEGTTPLALTVKMPGLHNAQNAVGAAALCSELGIPDEAIVKGLLEFAGVGRRFSDLGEVRWKSGSARLIDDYGHHPTEIEAVIKATKKAFPRREINLVFQPHRYTRTRDCFDKLTRVLQLPNKTFLFDIYSAGESEINQISSQNIIKKIKQRKGTYLNNFADAEKVILKKINTNSIVLIMGAGNISEFVKSFVKD